MRSCITTSCPRLTDHDSGVGPQLSLEFGLMPSQPSNSRTNSSFPFAHAHKSGVWPLPRWPYGPPAATPTGWFEGTPLEHPPSHTPTSSLKGMTNPSISIASTSLPLRRCQHFYIENPIVAAILLYLRVAERLKPYLPRLPISPALPTPHATSGQRPLKFRG
jgi:hypothetical protein